MRKAVKPSTLDKRLLSFSQRLQDKPKVKESTPMKKLMTLLIALMMVMTSVGSFAASSQEAVTEA